MATTIAAETVHQHIFVFDFLGLHPQIDGSIDWSLISCQLLILAVLPGVPDILFRVLADEPSSFLREGVHEVDPGYLYVANIV